MTLFAELKRRNVVRVGAAYAVIGWVLAQIAEFAFENFGAPEWVLKSFAVLLMLGLPLALFFAWAFEITPDGLKREKDVDRSLSITSQTGHKMDRTIIGVLIVALAWFAWDKFSITDGSDSAPQTEMAAGNGLQSKSVAVLPFIAMSSGPDDEFFADGLTEEILNSLSQLPELLVTARTSAFSFKGEDLPVQEIAAVLGVKHIVEGSVRRAGERLRVTAQLVRADDGFHLWSENYDSTATDTIAVQENIAEKIAAAMDIVLDEDKRAAMRRAGLRDVEAFMNYQKGGDLFDRAHDENDTTGGLRQANKYFENVIDRVPDFSQVYIDHSDFYIHLLQDDASGIREPGVTDDDMKFAYATAISDYESAVRHSGNSKLRLMAALDLAFVSGNWRGMAGRTERALDEPGCVEGNWTTSAADVFGYAKQFQNHSYDLLACDPLRTIPWFNAARAAFWAGDNAEALRLAREGTDVAPGSWLNVILIRSLLVNGEYDNARQEIDDRVKIEFYALFLKAMIAAHEGDQILVDELLVKYVVSDSDEYFWTLIFNAWAGHREEANRLAAKIDEHHFGSVNLVQVTHWCSCGEPWDMEATPNFAAKIEESGLPWPPPSPMNFPLKDW